MPPDLTVDEARRVAKEPPILRFDRVERAVHWVNATLFGILMLTGAALYAGPISALVGNREAVRFLHVYSGLLLPVPLLLGVLGRHGARLRADFGRLNRWSRDDARWFRRRQRAGVQDEATALRFHSFDGAYTESLTLAQARRNDVIAAYRFEGDALSDMHGGPVRLYVAPMYGYKSLKWLDRITLTKDVEEGYWEVRGYDVDGWVGRSNGRDDDAT